MTYIGEHLLWGKTGNFFIFLSFTAALFSSFSYFKSVQHKESEIDSTTGLPDEQAGWRRLGRGFFYIHSLGVIGIMATLFFMIFNHYYEYYYVWEHSNNSMPKRYTLACFWEGQEGSFLLWTFWQAVLGNILIRTAKSYEASVMTIIALVQSFLASMLLGFFIYGVKIGSNPFVLLRETPEFAGIPLFQMPDYVSKLDGRGLNPLLQNYWMTIHPPVLFLGFASAVVPFAYAIAGLWKKKYGEWQMDTIPWAYFGIMILGTGILMGGAWAYESLSFEGFWAWDPVENASLIPWLTFVGTGHILIIHKARKQSTLSTFIFPLLTFILVLYSTFLTRSGILGNTSVHAFTDLGLSGQLLVYLFFFILISIILIIINWRNIPRDREEEGLWSREFWMFLGALVLLMACLQVIITTSIPVTNKIFGLNQAPPADRIIFYNRWQIPFAILVMLMVSTGLYFKFKDTDMKQFFRMILFPLVSSVIITFFSSIILKERNGFYIALLFTCVFSVIANFNYWITAKKANILKSGAPFAHTGFGLIIMGALLSTSLKQVISLNTSGKSVESLGKDFSNENNILLTKGDTLRMGDYYVTYTGKSKQGHNMLYQVEFYSRDASEKKLKHEFTLHPLVQINQQMGNVAEPSTKHFLSKDIYTHITYADLSNTNEENDGVGYLTPKQSMVGLGDTLYSSNSIIILTAYNTHVDRIKYHLKANDIAMGAILKVTDVNGKTYITEPIYVITNDVVKPIDATLSELGLKLSFTKVDPESHKVEITLYESKHSSRDFIVLAAVVFPFINILWGGCIVMIVGVVLSIRQRIKKRVQLTNG